MLTDIANEWLGLCWDNWLMYRIVFERGYEYWESLFSRICFERYIKTLPKEHQGFSGRGHQKFYRIKEWLLGPCNGMKNITVFVNKIHF